MNLWLALLKNNLRGVLGGIIYTLVAWLVFATGISFADSCDTNDESCSSFIFMRPMFFIIAAPNLMVWLPLEYFLVQMPLVLVFGDQTNSYLATVNTVIVPAAFVPITVLLWVTIGAAIQEISRKIRK